MKPTSRASQRRARVSVAFQRPWPGVAALGVGLKTRVKTIMDDDPRRTSDEDTIIIVRSEEISEELELKQRRRSIGDIIFWIVSHVPGALVIWWGVRIHQKGRVLSTYRPALTGDTALGFSWVMIGLGIGSLAGLGALFENRPLLKWSLYIIAGIVFTYGIWLSFFK